MWSAFFPSTIWDECLNARTHTHTCLAHLVVTCYQVTFHVCVFMHCPFLCLFFPGPRKASALSGNAMQYECNLLILSGAVNCISLRIVRVFAIVCECFSVCERANVCEGIFCVTFFATLSLCVVFFPSSASHVRFFRRRRRERHENDHQIG